MDLHVKACPLPAAAKKPFQWTSSICSKILEAVYSTEPVGLQPAEAGAGAELAGLVEPRTGCARVPPE